MKIDTRVKLYIILSLSTLSIVKNNVALLAIYTITLILCYIENVSFKNYYKIATKMLAFVFPLIIVQSVFSSEVPIINIFNTTILSTQGLIYGVNFIIRILNITALGFILKKIPSGKIIDALVKLKIPYELAFMATIGISFLDVLRQEAIDTYNALSLRGINFSELTIRKKIDLGVYLIAPLINSTTKKAKKLTDSLELRGFRLHESRTSHKEVKLNSKDIYIIIINTFLLVLIMFI